MENQKKQRKRIILGGVFFLVAVSFLVFAEAGWALDFANPVNVNTPNELINSVLESLRLLIGTVAVVFIVIGGIMYMASAGDEKRMETAKAIVTASVIGLAIVFAGPSFLQQIQLIYNNAVMASGGSTPTVAEIFESILNFLLSVIGIIAIISLIAGGVMYMTSYGDDERMEKGKKMVTYSIIGIVVCLGSLVIVTSMANIF